MLANSSDTTTSSNSPSGKLSLSEIAARLRRLPPGPIQTQALLAFEKKYANRADLLTSPSDRSRYVGDPISWVQDKLGEFVWSKQREIFLSVANNRRTAVHSCHNVGKSWTASRIAAWWLESHPPGEAFVVTSAPTASQVRAVLWREIGRAHAKGRLTGRLNQTEWWMVMPQGNDEMVAFGRKPADMDPTSFQGIHARYVLVILDEACGIPQPLWEAADSLISNNDSRILVIGNPDDPLSEFANVCKPGSGWNVIGIDAFETPNFTGEEVPEKLRHNLISPTWEAEKRRKWGEDNPLYISKIRGQFPEISSDGLIPITWIKAAQERTLAPSAPTEIGLDVGGGADKSTICLRRGPVARIIRRDQNPDTMQTLGHLIAAMKEHGATSAKVDKIGIGWGACDRAAEISKDKRETPDTRKRAAAISGIHVGESAEDSESFANLRAEGFWGLRERFQEGSIDIDEADDDLAAQLVDLRYKRTSSGRIQIESKEDMRRRGKSSPDDADALMLAFLRAAPAKKKGGVW